MTHYPGLDALKVLSDEQCVARVSRAIASIEAAPKDWWNIATNIIRTEATAFHREVAPPQEFNIMGRVLTSTKHKVCPQAWAYLKTKGHNSPTEAATYSLLVALYEKERRDKTGTLLVGKLTGIWGGEGMRTQSGIDRHRQINKLMEELQCQRRLGAVRDKSGSQLTQPLKIATTLRDHWEGVSKEGLMSVEECTHFRHSLPLPANFNTMARALFKPLTQELVDEALFRQATQ